MVSIGGDVSKRGGVRKLPFKGGGHGHRLGNASGLDDDLIEAAGAGQLTYGIDEIFAQGAADTAIG